MREIHCTLSHSLTVISSLLTAPFYAPLSRNETQRKIIFLTENVSEETKNVLKSIYKDQALEEINNRDANELLVRSTGIPLTTGASQQTILSENST
jgi:hypothetical protein